MRLAPALKATYSVLRQIREVATEALGQALAEKKIGSSLGAWPTVYAPPAMGTDLSSDLLEELCLTSRLYLLFETPPDSSFQKADTPLVGVVLEQAKGE